jgi:alpha-1,6-mannosyltransferase
VMGALAWWCWRYATVEDCGSYVSESRRGAPRFLRGAMLLGFAMMLLFSPHYPWYIVWLVPFFALTPNLPLLAYLMAFYYGFATELADPGPKMFLLNKLIYGFVALVILLQVTVLRRWPLRGLFGVEARG